MRSREPDGGSDAEVILRSVHEPEVFKLVFERHFHAVHRYPQRRLGADLADELAAETFVQAFDSRRRYQRAGHPTSLSSLFGSLPS
jgi:DNA-directed RNA polymerase specialized sigma24 family protein